MKLTASEKRELLAGKRKTVLRPDEPECEKGDTIVLSQTKGSAQVVPDQHDRNKAAVDQRGNPIVVKSPPIPDAWVTVRGKRPKKGGGGWIVDLKLTDRRDQPLYLAKDVTEGDYTSSPVRAGDDLEVLDDDAQKQVDMRRRLAAAEKKHEGGGVSELALRNQERAAREELRGVLRGLDPQSAQALLAGVMREIRAAKSGKMAA